MRNAFSGLLLMAILAPAVLAAPASEAPLCELYAVGHFGNWSEVAGVNEMRSMLTEAKRWGYNRCADWFDMIDCVEQ